MNIEKAINQAAKIIPISWPLKSMIALNPLWDLQEMPFVKAVDSVKQYIDIKGCLAYDDYVQLYYAGSITNEDLKTAFKEFTGQVDVADNHVQLFFSEAVINYYRTNDRNDRLYFSPEFSFRNKLLEFISGYFDNKQHGWHKNDSQYPLFSSWRKYAVIEDNTRGEWLYDLPEDINQAVEKMLLRLKISPNEFVPFFSWILSQLIGWNSLVKWIESRPNNPLIDQKATLAEMILIWCCLLVEEKSFNFQVLKNEKLEKAKLGTIDANIMHDPSISLGIKELCVDDLSFIWQRAYEIHQHKLLLDKITSQNIIRNTSQQRSSAQFVFCIDTRSEGIRRHLEKNEKYETFGFAGFFGSLFSLRNTETDECSLQAPALVEPNVELTFTSVAKATSSKLSKLYKKTTLGFKDNLFSPFAFFEMIGNIMSLPLIGKTLAPIQYHYLVDGNKSDCSQGKIANEFLKPELIESAVDSLYYFLKTIGLIDNMAPIVVICGHQAQTENNPFQASFDCGACGGNSGAANAEVTCEILNNQQARKLLEKRGVRFGLNTTFIPAYHNTTTDELIISSQYYSKIPSYDQFKSDIAEALNGLRAERMKDLPAINKANDRHINWAELIPEWGLANNMAMIIGPRHYTKQINLQRRVFLHSYDYENDIDGALLGSILTAPVVVGHWINSQYYFSATDPDIYGSGNKAIHNIVGQVGVMEGNLSDLKIGLPIQSIFYKDQLIHQPLRLLIVIFASSHLVNELLNKYPHIKSLFDNQWLSLKIIEPETMHGISR